MIRKKEIYGVVGKGLRKVCIRHLYKTVKQVFSNTSGMLVL